jgi:DNA-directed RNA polymerase specialized sigma24 family protein
VQPFPCEETLIAQESKLEPRRRKRLVRSYRESRSEAAFRELFRSFSAAPYRLALRMLNDRRDAEDALHDAWIRACEGIAGFRGESSFCNWLVGICANRCREMKARNESHEYRRNRISGRVPAWIGAHTPQQSAREIVVGRHQLCDECFVNEASMVRLVTKLVCVLG